MDPADHHRYSQEIELYRLDSVSAHSHADGYSSVGIGASSSPYLEIPDFGLTDGTASTNRLLERSPSSRQSIPSPEQTEIIQPKHQSEHFPHNDESDNKAQHATATKLWTPALLHRRSFWGFALLYGILIITLAVLLVVDGKHQGIADVKHDEHYAWSYGPTLILSLMAASWDQVDYWIRRLAPWVALGRGPSLASDTLLLDYVSKAQIVTFWKSLRRLHLLVFLGTASSLLIKLLIVFSTGLLSPQSVQLSVKDVSLRSEGNLDAAAWNKTTNVTIPAIFALGVSMLNMSYPPGTSSQFAMPPMRLSNTLNAPSNATIDTTADAFHGDLRCEPGAFYIFDIQCNSKACYEMMPDIQVSSPSCQVHRAQWPSSIWLNSAAASNYLFGMMFTMSCNETTNESPDRLFFAAGRFGIRQTVNEPTEARPADNVTLWVCEPNNVVAPVSVKIDSAGALLSAEQSSSGRSLSQTFQSITDWDMIKRFQSSVDGGGSTFDGIWEAMNTTLTDIDTDETTITIDGEQYQTGFDDFFYLYLATQQPRTTADFLDSDSLQSNSRALYSLITAQIAADSLIAPGETSSIGTLHTTQQRLRVRGLSMYGMLATLGLLLVSALISSFISPCRVVSRDPSSIGGLATILARSQGLSDILSTHGFSSTKRLKEALDAYTCQIAVHYLEVSPKFAIDMNRRKAAEPREDIRRQDRPRWWRPFSLSAWMKSAVAIVMAALVVALELVFEKSQKSDGLADANEDSDARYAWRYVPGILMLSVSMAIGMIASSSKIILPYHDLRHWPCNSRTTLLDDELSRPAVVSLYTSLMHHHWNILVITIAVILAFPLTIVSSGLYSVATFNSKQDAVFQVDNGINFTSPWSSAIADPPLSRTSLVVSMLLDRNSSEPLWTHEQYVFPQLKLESLGGNMNNSQINETAPGSTISVRMPAWHSSFDCSFVPESDRNVGINNGEYNSQVYIDLKTPPGCNDTLVHLDSYGGFEPNTTGAICHESQTLAYIAPECPYIVLTYGTLPASNGSAPSLTVLACRASVNETQVNATVEVPSLRVLSVEPDQSTSQYISTPQIVDSWTDGEPISFEIVPLFSKIETVIGSIWPTNWTDNSWSSAPPLLTAVVTLNPGSRLTDFMGQDNSTVVADTLSKLWTTVYPQLANQAGRVSQVDVGPPVPNTVSGVLTKHDRVRLVQNEVSTRILQVLLGLIAICVVLSLWSMNVQEVLPKDPCSIAATASLLAGSDILHEGIIPPGSEWCSDEALRKRGIFEGYQFSMGWWEAHDKQRFGIGIGKARWSQ